nr:hypothetical protein [Methanophagales archaeon]
MRLATARLRNVELKRFHAQVSVSIATCEKRRSVSKSFPHPNAESLSRLHRVLKVPLNLLIFFPSEKWIHCLSLSIYDPNSPF